MATRKDSVWLTERITQEKAKIAALEARRTDPDQQTPYEPRDTFLVAVPSLLKPNDEFIRVPVATESLTKIAGGTGGSQLAELGLKLPAGVPVTAALRPNKYATALYPKIQIMHGDPSPTRQVTEWKTTWIKKYAKSGDQSHRLIPFGPGPGATGTISFDDIVDNFERLFNATTGTLRANVGAAGMVSLIMGKRSAVYTITYA